MRIRLLNRKLLVRRSAPVEQTRTGLTLPASARERPQTGTVVARSARSDLPIGALVLMPMWHDRYVWFKGERLEWIDEDQILAEIVGAPLPQEDRDETK